MILIYGIKGHLNPIKENLSDVVHSCVRSVLGLPEHKRFHRFFPMAKEDFYYGDGRTESYTVIEINLMAGRQPDTIKRLIKLLFAEIESQLSIPPIDVEIIVHEQPSHCWGFRGMTGDEANDLAYKVNM